MISQEAGIFLLEQVKDAIVLFLNDKSMLEKPLEYPEELDFVIGVFVTLYQRDSQHKYLRGSAGFPYPDSPLIEAAIDAAILACSDMRFVPLKKEEIHCLTCEISLLGALKEVEASEIKPGEKGIVLQQESKYGVFLPLMWKDFKMADDFLDALSRKAGLSDDAWKDEATTIYEFSEQVLSMEL